MLYVLFAIAPFFSTSQGTNASHSNELEEAPNQSHITPEQIIKSSNETLWIPYQDDKPIETAQTYAQKNINSSRNFPTSNITSQFINFTSSSSQGTNVSHINKLEEALKLSHIIPKQMIKSPNETLWIRYKVDKPIEAARTYTKENIKGVPRVRWHCDRPPVYYTLICIGLNEWQLFDKKPTITQAPIPSPDLIKWLVVNIPQNDYREGAIIHPYKYPTPVLGYDKLVYLFLVYKQRKGIRAYDYRYLETTNMKQFGPERKQDFPHLRALEKFYNISDIVAANFFWYKFEREEIMAFFDSGGYYYW